MKEWGIYLFLVGGIGMAVFGRLMISWLLYMMRRFGTPGALFVVTLMGVLIILLLGLLIAR